MAMEWTLLKQSDYSTTRWSGGTTTQLAIAPEGAQYAGRDFLWRISSAQVELEHSDFTPLPDYDRFLAVLDGHLELKVGDEERTPLPCLTVRSFDGGLPTQSWGKCTDFNLMVRKGQGQGAVHLLRLPASGTATLTPETSGTYPTLTLALFCVSGALNLPGAGLTAQAGDLLLCRDAAPDVVRVTAHIDTTFFALTIQSKA